MAASAPGPVTREWIEGTGLHEAEVVLMERLGDRVRLGFDDLPVDLECVDRYRVAVEMRGVWSVTRDGEPVEALGLEAEASEVLRFERCGDAATLAVVWHDHAARRRETRLYAFRFGTFDLSFSLARAAPWPE